MEIKLIRTDFTVNTCTAELRIDNGPRFCYMLNRRDRGLDHTMSLAELTARKVQDATAHTTGRFQCVMAWSTNFQANVPHLLNVPGFGLIELHVGNFERDSHACNLFGLTKGADYVGESKVAYQLFLNATFNKIPHTQPVWVTTVRDQKAWSDFIAKNPLPKIKL